jgi:hypothetical protein
VSCPQIKYNNLTVVPLTTAATTEDIATALMATWFPNNRLAPRPNLAIYNDKWGSRGSEGASVCAQSFLTERIGDYVYIQV